MKRTQLLCFAMALLALSSPALADSFAPTSVNATIDVGQSFNVTKTFTIDGRNSNTPVDILFLFDTTNSFAPYYGHANWSSTAASLVTQATSRFNDVQFAVAQYEDYPITPWGAATDVEYNRIQNFGNAATTTTTLQGLASHLGVGGDDAESNLVGLGAAAGEAGWRSGAVKIVIWVGDQPGHVPGELGVGIGGIVVYPGTVDTDGAIAALLAGDQLVEAFNFGKLDGNLREGPTGIVLDTAQATAITTATGGDLWTITTNPTDPGVGLASFLTHYSSALDDAFALFSLGLDVSALPAGLGLSIVPPGSTSGDRTTFSGTAQYQWLLTFTGNAPGTYTFPIHGLIDGKILDTEWDNITVRRGGDQPPPDGVVPEPTSFALLGLGLLGVGVAARRRKK